MSKEVVFESGVGPGGQRTRLELIERDAWWRKRRVRHFTVSTYDLKDALRSAGLLGEKVVVQQVDTAREIANDIAWFTSLKDQTGGTPDAKRQRETLWNRITEALRLS